MVLLCLHHRCQNCSFSEGKAKEKVKEKDCIDCTAKMALHVLGPATHDSAVEDEVEVLTLADLSLGEVARSTPSTQLCLDWG